MKIQSRSTLILTVALGALMTPIVYSQTATGRIVGTVTDPTGAVIPNATITVVDEKTGQERKGTADTIGYYVISNLAPSTYKITAQGSGLGPTELTGIPLSVGQERHVNIILQPSSQATEITDSVRRAGGDRHRLGRHRRKCQCPRGGARCR